MQIPLNDLMQKKMDRKDFLKHVAIGAVLLTGAGAVIRALQQTTTSPSPSAKVSDKTSSLAYGSSVYGGVEAKRG